jgi:hypothetical protein
MWQNFCRPCEMLSRLANAADLIGQALFVFMALALCDPPADVDFDSALDPDDVLK